MQRLQGSAKQHQAQASGRAESISRRERLRRLRATAAYLDGLSKDSSSGGRKAKQ